ncbi:hypothetical protein SteCoe_21366 [Stentor coeruleus]|uniref:C2H2-type domain-containing protein n=1 Tax=Stentor coeruleus TaxID=5963 RepID=A0A1R2BQ84_9CILI|nr:hypothetical protein SteCoe_21366 [Stentor coeruleus]
MVDITVVLPKSPYQLPKPIDIKTGTCVYQSLVCTCCHLIFQSEQDLQLHKTTEERRISCSMCSIKFLTTKGMKQHFGKKHEKSRPYRCNICYKKFRNVYASRIHKQQVHLHASRQSCSYCGKSVYNKYSLSRHLKVCNRYSKDLETFFE